MKTFKVESFKNQINAKLKSASYTEHEKAIFCDVLEMVLKQSNNYKGYTYLKGAPAPGEPGFYSREYS